MAQPGFSISFVLKDGERCKTFQALVEKYLVLQSAALFQRREKVMLNRAFTAFVYMIWPEAREVRHQKSDYTNVGSHDKILELDTTTSHVTRFQGYYEIALYAKSNGAVYEYKAVVLADKALDCRTVNTHFDFDWFMDLPSKCQILERLLNDAYGVSDFRVLSFEARHGLGSDLSIHQVVPDGQGYFELEGHDSTGQHDVKIIAERAKGVGGLPSPVFFQISKYICATKPCGGCNVCNPASVWLNTGLGTPHTPMGQFTGGVIKMPSNVVPVMLTPGSNYLPSKSALMNKNLQALNNSKPMNPKSPKDVTEILQFLEREIDVKIGMLSSQNIFLHRVTIYDREDWEEKLRGELDSLRRRLGDKVGVIGDMRITNLDEIDYPEASPLHGSKPTTAVGRKFSVHAAYRMDYQAIKLTIMALVKA